MDKLEILYQDDVLVAVNKPSGMLVHKTKIAADVATGFALQILRDQIGQYVYPLHRIDRPTSGILLFALNPETTAKMKLLFDDQRIEKRYLAICRGHFPDEHVETKALKKENGSAYQEAETHLKCIEKTEIALPNDRFPTTRFSLVEARPKTGRMHQIRKHLKYMGYPIIGDTTYGDLKINNLINQKIGPTGLCLHAQAVHFEHPEKKEVTAVVSNHFSQHFQMLGGHLGFF